MTTDRKPEPEYESIRRKGGEHPTGPVEADEPEYESIRRPGGEGEAERPEAGVDEGREADTRRRSDTA